MRLLLTIMLTCVWLLPRASAGIMDILLPRNDLRVVTYTETTPEGARLPPVSPSNPVYYVAVNVGFRDFGVGVAGEKAPLEKDALQIIGTVLRKQGYLPCDDEHMPTLVLVIGWGTLNASMNSGDPDNGGYAQYSIENRLRFLGAHKLNPNLVSDDPQKDRFLREQPVLIPLDSESELLRSIASDNLFVLAISAYDFHASKSQDKKKLWMTKIACPSKGFWMKEAFPSMVAIAGPNIGRETPKPVCVEVSDKRKGEVKIGDSIVVEYLGEDKAKPADDKGKPAAESKQEPVNKTKGQK